MDGQNYNNEQNNGDQNNVVHQNSYYQDYTANIPYQGTPGQMKAERTNGAQIASLVCGILSLLTICCYGVPGLIFGIIGLICAIVGNRRSKSGIGVAGLVCSIVGLIFNVVVFTMMVLIVKAFIDIFRENPALLEDPELLNDSDALMRLLMEYYGR